MLTYQCNCQPHNDLASLLSGLDNATPQQSIQPPVVIKKANSNNALLQNLLQQQQLPSAQISPQKDVENNALLQELNSSSNNVISSTPVHSKGQIDLFLQSLQNENQVPSPKKTESNALLLKNFLQKMQSPLYKKAMSILSDKQLQKEYQLDMAKIQLFFMNFSMKELQSFHVQSVPPRNLSSMLDELSVSQVQTSSHTASRNNLATMLSSMSQENPTVHQEKNVKPRNNAQLLAALQSQS